MVGVERELNEKESKQLIEVLERLTRLETQFEMFFKAYKKDILALKELNSGLKGELSEHQEQIKTITNSIQDVKGRYEKMLWLWKVVALFLSPIITSLALVVIQKTVGV